MASVMRFDEWQDSNGVTIYNGAEGALGGGGFTASTTITATDAAWAVPTLDSPIVKVTVIGGGGAGAIAGTDGGNGGTTTFNAGAAGTVTAAGGLGGARVTTSKNATAGFASGNLGHGFTGITTSQASNGNGGAITVAYLDLTGISTVNVTIGAGGARPSSEAGNGGRGEVIVEYVAG